MPLQSDRGGGEWGWGCKRPLRNERNNSSNGWKIATVRGGRRWRRSIRRNDRYLQGATEFHPRAYSASPHRAPRPPADAIFDYFPFFIFFVCTFQLCYWWFLAGLCIYRLMRSTAALHPHHPQRDPLDGCTTPSSIEIHPPPPPPPGRRRAPHCNAISSEYNLIQLFW